MKLPTLYCHSKKGKVKQWDTAVIMRDNMAIIQSWAGYTDGKKQLAEVEVTEGKNLGKANETTVWEQACFEAESRWKKKIDSGYTEVALEQVEEGEEQNEGKYPLPMLAKEYLEELDDVIFPVVTQAKHNGVRCRAGFIDGQFVMWSRKGKVYTVMMEHFRDAVVPILNQLNRMYPNAHLDGEFYCHGLHLQTINSGVKAKNEITEQIQYHIYDIAEPTLTQEEREKARFALLAGLPTNGLVVCAESVFCNSDEEVQLELKRRRDQKYEGLIVRLTGENSTYLNRHRSNSLLKLKEFMDKEFRIIGGFQGKGKYKGTVIFTCITEDGKPFDVTPMGTMEQRRQWFKELDTFIGKYLTVRFQEYSKDGIPVILKGIDAAVVRDYE